MIGELILEVFDLIELLENSRDEETMGEEGHKHKADEVD